MSSITLWLLLSTLRIVTVTVPELRHLREAAFLNRLELLSQA